MKRQALDDGRWFNLKEAQKYDEGLEWDGNNQISKATGVQWDHQRLYRTRRGMWVLKSWSDRQGVMASWEELDIDAVARWLSKNEHEPPEECREEFDALEI